MRRIDIIWIGLGLFGAGGLIYLILQLFGLKNADAGIWSQAILIVGLMGWVLTYLVRAVSHKMTFSQQVQDYKEAVLQKRLEELTPEELAQLQAEMDDSTPATAAQSPQES